LKRDVPLSEFETVKVLKNKEESSVSVVMHKPSKNQYVMKAYNREIVAEKGLIDSILAERDILR
jgi:hypothetical protein